MDGDIFIFIQHTQADKQKEKGTVEEQYSDR